MENLEELKKKYAELGAEIERIEKGQQGRWKPENEEYYWYVTGDGSYSDTRYEDNNVFDNSCFKLHNCFKTEKEAQNRADKIKIYWQLYDLAERLNKGEKIDWKDDMQRKYYILLDSIHKSLHIDDCYAAKKMGQIYCLDENFLHKAIEEIRRR